MNTNSLNDITSGIDLKITKFEGTTPHIIEKIELNSLSTKSSIKIDNTLWDVGCTITEDPNNNGTYKGKATFTIKSGKLQNANVSIGINLKNWSEENYVMMPAAVYNGNRFRVLRKKYPPMLQREDGWGKNIDIVMNDNPHLKKEGPNSKIHLRSGDMATPCVNIRFAKNNQGLQLLAKHNTPFGYTGFLLSESDDRKNAYLQLEVPAVREKIYRQNRTDIASDDRGWDFKEGDKVELDFNIYVYDCPDIPSLYDLFCDTRKDLSEEAELNKELPFSKAFKIIESKYNKDQYNSTHNYYRVGVDNNKFNDWQAGWVGGGMNSFALMMDGNTLSKERSDKTMDSIFTILQAPSGFIYGNMFDGKKFGDNFLDSNINILLLRKNADVLIFAGKQIILKEKRNETIPSTWISGYKKLADAFIRLWEDNGQFGQFIDIEKEKIIIGNTSSTGIAIGGLALASKVLKDKKYLNVAIESGKYYYDEYVQKGISNGGPGEIMQAPDSESTFGLLLSYVTLYEVTSDNSWLPIAEDCAKQCASWCMSYDFDFPEDSVFGQLSMKTTGSVYANVQNKHSAPGICTLSGISLLKLYRATGNEFYLTLLNEIAHNITQYLSREDRPILSWDNQYLPAGWMCERVNTCDWEGKDKIGGVFCGGCWCEVSTLLTYSEIPGVYLLSDTGQMTVMDNINVSINDNNDSWQLTFSNNTKFDADVKLLSESSKNLSNPLGECALEKCTVVSVKSGENVVISLLKNIRI